MHGFENIKTCNASSNPPTKVKDNRHFKLFFNLSSGSEMV